jgi:DNA-binding NarL/FixJ family response regulator
VQAIRDVLCGRSVLAGWSARTTPGHDAGLGTLSARQREVLRLVVAGWSNAQIAAELVISVNTVKFHVRTIFRELGIRSRVDAARRFGSLAAGVSAP